MVYGASNQLMKFLVFISNFLIFIFGALVFGFSLWANLDQNFSVHLRDFARQAKLDEHFVEELAQYQASLWVLVAVGALLLVVGFLGCCGAACENAVLLALFNIILLILALVELFVLVYLFTNRSELFDSVHKALLESSKTEEGRRNLKPIQAALRCCGATLSTQNLYKQDDLCPGDLSEKPDCYAVLSAAINTMDNSLLISGIFLLIFQLLSLMFSSALCRAFRQRSSPQYYYIPG